MKCPFFTTLSSSAPITLTFRDPTYPASTNDLSKHLQHSCNVSSLASPLSFQKTTHEIISNDCNGIKGIIPNVAPSAVPNSNKAEAS
ncbi:hypothetical protein H5410_028657 [Solanum commersonii]|uniref:Uncharacterized protein n=1 Tax=Solanum commersonii TaxID=4109 RepID=A0A9J5Z4M1_SOLCO|nr:hypothetical protein H5410_028657 [Solanum commersonii]